MLKSKKKDQHTKVEEQSDTRIGKLQYLIYDAKMVVPEKSKEIFFFYILL